MTIRSLIFTKWIHKLYLVDHNAARGNRYRNHRQFQSTRKMLSFNVVHFPVLGSYVSM